MSDTVYICYEWRPPEATGANHYHTVGDWVVAGIVEEQEDADLWMEPATPCDGSGEKDRRVTEVTLNVVEAFYTQKLQQ
jgi:hypothetical protein